MNETSFPMPRPKGEGVVTYRCADCGELIVDEEPVLTTRDGRLVALHQKHEEVNDGR